MCHIDGTIGYLVTCLNANPRLNHSTVALGQLSTDATVNAEEKS